MLPVRHLVILMAILFLSPLGQSAELVTFGQNMRNLGMGGVRSFNGDQGGVQLWNPAGMAFSNGVRWDVLNVGAGINGKEAYELSKTISTVNGLGSLGAFYGKPIWVGSTASSSLILPYFGVSFYNDFSSDFFLNNPTLPELKVKYFNDVGIMLGGSGRIGDLGFGVNVKQINRTGGNKVIGSDLLASINQTALAAQFQDGGIGYGLDLGVMYKPQVLLNPTVSVGYQDVGNTTFQKTKGSQAPPAIEDNLTLGATLGADTLLAGFTAGFEYRHINTTGEPLGKKVHVGTEINLLNFDLRAGLYQGYPTYGLGVDLFFLQLEGAVYTVERGAYPGQTPDQRFQVGISSSIGFDPNFKLMGFGGKKRNLKQRR